MCGIAGILNYNKFLKDDEDIIKRMTRALVHRGPDQNGYYSGEHVLLGHRRLAIIDIERGKQPMSYTRGEETYTIVYNGELYNTDEVRDELIQLGYYFSTYCDTEVILKGYAHFKEKILHKLNGIFAFAIFENKEQTLFLGRDPAGVKPLFYTYIKGNFLFASEIKSIFESRLINPVFDENSLLELFSLGPSRMPGSGLFKDVKEVKAGSYMIITRQSMREVCYWKPKVKEHKESLLETIEKTRYLVTDAVKGQLVSDVPICTFLSGGLDSSGISAIAAKHLLEKGRRLTTYALDYEGNDIFFKGDAFQPTNDKEWGIKVAEHIDSDHEIVTLDIDDLADYLFESAITNDYPGMADVDASLLLFCKEVRKKHTVALSGECADEIFGGYPWYRDEALVMQEGFPWIRHMEMRESVIARRLAHYDLKGYGRYAYDETVKEIEYLDKESKMDRGIRRLTYLNYKWFMATLLTRKDRMSMYNSLEVRVPFADVRLLEYIYNVPWQMKCENGLEKSLLRKALEGTLPKEVIYRKKSPYPKTYNPYYTKCVCTLLENILDKKDAPIHQLVNSERVRHMILTKGEAFLTPWFGQLMKGPQFMAYLVQLNYFLEAYHVTVDA